MLFNSALRIRGQANAMCWLCCGEGGELALLGRLPRGTRVDCMDAHSMHELRWWILPKWQPVTQTVGFENSTERSGRGAHRERDDQRVSLSRERFYCWWWWWCLLCEDVTRLRVTALAP